MELNIPWVHSPFFEEELMKRQLNTEQKALAEAYHKEGYLHLKGAVDATRIDALVAELQEKHDDKFSFEDPRTLDLWKESEKVKQLAAQEGLLQLIEMLYDRKPIPFQTLNFKYGSQQRAHSDTIHFNSLPKSYMCGIWVALEDVDEENGTLTYYPGSHHLAEYDYSMFHKAFIEKPEPMAHRKDYTEHYEPFIEKVMTHRGLKAVNLKAKKGDVLIWAANLVHGGLPVKDKNRTRWSQVTHYFFEDCLYTTPMLSNPVAGEWFLRQIKNVGTGEVHKGTYNGQEVNRKRILGQRTLISSQAGFNKKDLDLFIGRVYQKLFGKH